MSCQDIFLSGYSLYTSNEVKAVDEMDYYRQLPYRLEITPCEGIPKFCAEYPELPGCRATGMTLEEVIQNAETNKAKWLMENNHFCKRYYSTHEHDLIDHCMEERFPLKVAAYIRENIPKNGLRSPIELQHRLYESVIMGHPGWKLAGVFWDKGNAMQIQNRPGLRQLVAACAAGQVDVILCKNMSRLFVRREDIEGFTKRLSEYDPPIAIFFEAEKFLSLPTSALEK